MSLTNTVEGVLPLSIYTVLKGEHREVSSLFTALEASPESMESGREGTFHKLRKELLSHAKAEQTAVYDRVKAKTRKTDLIKDAEEEHKDMEERLNKILSLSASTDDWMNEVKALKAAVEHHVKEEESEMFKEMEALFNDEEAKEMAKTFHELKQHEAEKLDA